VPRLFLCDDAPAYRHLLREIFRDEEDLEIVGEASDGRECLLAVPEADPDVVLLDLNMPRMDGRQALSRLRAVAPSAQVVVLSSEHPDVVEDDVLALGAVAFIQKPIDAFSLTGLMREKVRSLDRRRTPRAATRAA
jgi:DNA-binding NarL/FixJ family response regulator